MGKLFEIIRPRSLDDPTYESYEYLIRWIGEDGSDYLYMFYDAELRTRVNTEPINQKNQDNIESLVSKEERTITLTAENVSQNDLEVIGQMFKNKFVTRLKKDGTTERYATDSNSYRYRLIELRYNIEFTLILYEKPVWK